MRRNTVVTALVAAAGLFGAPAVADPLTVFAAASTADAVGEAARLHTARGGPRVRVVAASSGALARQILHGAPADLFVSADARWMDEAVARGGVVRESRRGLLGNRLVLVAPRASRARPVAIGPGLALSEMLGDGRLAVGDPAHVPAGAYARAALERLGLWDEVEPRLARALDVRAALVLVERGEAPLGIVYATDAAASARVRRLGTFPPGCHPPIRVEAAVVADGDRAAAGRLLATLGSPEAAAVFRRHGFTVGGAAR